MIPCTELIPSVEALELPGDHFIRLEFNLVLIVLIAINATSCKFMILGWLIDVIAGFLLYYGTYSRKKVLNSVDWAQSVDAAVNADGQVVEYYLVLSVLTWFASTLFEAKSCLFLLKIELGSYKVRNLSKKNFVFLLLSVLATGNACWLMLLFTGEVHQSFECVTQDKLLLIYFWMAALAKNFRVFLQGLVFSSRIAAHSWEFLSNEDNKRDMMARMAFSNVITLRVLLWVVDHYGTGEPWTPKLLLTFLSVVLYLLYHLIIIAWFVHNSSLKQTLLAIVTNPRNLPGIFRATVRGYSVTVRTGIHNALNRFTQFLHVQDPHAHPPLPPPRPLAMEEEGPILTPDKNELVASKSVLPSFPGLLYVTDSSVNLHSTKPQHIFHRYDLGFLSTARDGEEYFPDSSSHSQSTCDPDSALPWRQCIPCQDNDHEPLLEEVVMGRVHNIHTVEKSTPVY